ncbi:response regulator [Magnetospirillum sp. UT-4]|uniref:response regulator n=1 Tax=Magnetospirillum sp. UT-4 TaxID=2681467 RepID=UPI001385EC1F|nr:response regulator [Magnetospirillum sp. UT-4]CAA7626477.1 putative signal transduction histidine kinase [Magnetospirillum sp. UT-4]
MGPFQVLVVEDDPADARLVELMLRRARGGDFQVECVSRLGSAIERLKRGGIDVVLADLSLPDSSGLATIAELTRAAPDLPVVVLTGNDDDSQAIEALKHGAQDYLVKGRGDAYVLTRVVRHAIERKGGERALTEARDAAEAAVHAKSIFLATVGHEIRTPLNGVLGMARLLLDTPLDQRQRAFAETILASGELLLGLVNDILDFSRLEAERLELEEVPFDLFDLVEETRLMLAPRAADKGLMLGCRFAPALPRMVAGDPLRLRQVLLNLVGNAIKFTDRGGVTIQLASLDSAPSGMLGLRVTVEDTGVGIADAVRGDLFTEFSQADTSIARRFGGTGLGLAICKRLVTLMGGEIGYDSRPGGGSTFWFTAMLAEADATSLPPEGAVPDESPCAILLVDDNQVNLDVATGLLVRRGHRVAAVADGVQALAAAARERFDLILLDMHMPAMDGLELARRIRASGSVSAVAPIWLLTANPVDHDARLWREAGIDGCLAKPFRAEEVARLLAGRQADPIPGLGGAGGLVVLPDLLVDLRDLGHERMRGLVDLFRQSSGEDLRVVLARAEAKDLPGLAAGVHRMASAASSLHLTALSEHCRAIEDAARAGDGRAAEMAAGLAALWDRSLAALVDAVS